MPGATSPKLVTGPEVGDGGPLSSTLNLPLTLIWAEGFEEMRCPWPSLIFSWASASMVGNEDMSDRTRSPIWHSKGKANGGKREKRANVPPRNKAVRLVSTTSC